MSRPRTSQPVVTRSTRSSTTPARQARPQQPQASGPSLPGSQQGRQTASGLAQGLSMMTVRGQEEASSARRSRGGSGPVSQGSGSGSGPGRKAVPGSGPKGGVAKLSQRGGVASVARLLKQGLCKNVVVVAGAGISTASGILDFRTPGTGLYANLEKYNIPYPEAIFDIDFFSGDPRPFFSLARELYPGRHRPNYIHYFIRMLHHKGLLLRMYTQNIDGLEKECGIPDDKLVEAHGSFATAACHLCYTPFPAEEAKSSIMSGQVPVCGFCAGTVKPNIVFFGEDLPEKYFQHTTDFPNADLLIVMGTSLQIEPFASLVNTVRPGVPRLLLNRDAVGPFAKTPRRQGDHLQLGDLVESVRRLADILGWHDDIHDLMSSLEPETISATVGGSGQQPCKPKATGLGRRGATQPPAQRPPKSRPGAQSSAPSSEEGEDSDSDSKSTASSSPSN